MTISCCGVSKRELCYSPKKSAGFQVIKFKSPCIISLGRLVNSIGNYWKGISRYAPKTLSRCVTKHDTSIRQKKFPLKFIENILTIDPIVHQNHINSYENEIDELLLFVLMFTIHILLRLFTTKNDFRIFGYSNFSRMFNENKFCIVFSSKQPEQDWVNYSWKVGIPFFR